MRARPPVPSAAVGARVHRLRLRPPLEPQVQRRDHRRTLREDARRRRVAIERRDRVGATIPHGNHVVGAEPVGLEQLRDGGADADPASANLRAIGVM